MAPLPLPVIGTFNNSSYKLDMSGVVGMLGGDYAADALGTIHLYAGRRWAGWYNYPGVLTVARRFGQMADSRLWDSLFPGPNECPAVTFGLAGKPGPRYCGLFSGTKLCTGYLGYLLTEETRLCHSMLLKLVKKDGTEGRKTGNPAAVAIVSLLPREHGRPMESQTPAAISKPRLIPIRPKRDLPVLLWAIVPSLVSTLACVFCFLTGDYTCASLILLGIIFSGTSSLVLGSAELNIRVPVPSPASPPGDGLMFPEDGNVIVLKGEEADVNVVTKGEFELNYSAGIMPHEKHHTIGASSLLLMAQFLIQLLLIPRCSLFGQILFLVSFIVSGGYHLYVASHEREQVHRLLLSQELSGRMERWILGTRTQMAVFVCLVLGNGQNIPSKSNPDAVLSHILPNDTPVWKCWKKKVVRELEHFWERGQEASRNYDPQINVEEDGPQDEEYSKIVEEKDKQLLKDLIDDAWCVFKKYPEWRDSETLLWREGGEDVEENGYCLLGRRSPV